MTSAAVDLVFKKFVNKKLKPKIKYDADANKNKLKNLYQNP